MVVKRHWDSAEELYEFLKSDRPPTDDDHWIDGDGTVIDTPAKFMDMLNRDLERRRERAAAAQRTAPDRDA